MRKGFIFLSLCLSFLTGAFAAGGYIPKKFNTVTSHDDVYPYRLNNAKPNTTNKNSISSNTANSTSSTTVGKRNVIRRKTNARAAIAPEEQNNISNTPRRVVQRKNPSGTRYSNNVTARTAGGRGSQNVITKSAKTAQAKTTTSARTTNANYNSTEKISSQECFANYKKCMESYCQREDTAYNRCYCSAKLAQIDSKYQDKIDSLIQQIIRLQYASTATSEEIKEYWNQSVGVYTNTNPWVDIDNALNISWADAQSRVRGQNAFNTGHEYCAQYLRGCYYMASNMRNAYKSEISRDCDAYEKSLQRIQNAAESVIESYK